MSKALLESVFSQKNQTPKIPQVQQVPTTPQGTQVPTTPQGTQVPPTPTTPPTPPTPPLVTPVPTPPKLPLNIEEDDDDAYYQVCDKKLNDFSLEIQRLKGENETLKEQVAVLQAEKQKMIEKEKEVLRKQSSMKQYNADLYAKKHELLEEKAKAMAVITTTISSLSVVLKHLTAVHSKPEEVIMIDSEPVVPVTSSNTAVVTPVKMPKDTPLEEPKETPTEVPKETPKEMPKGTPLEEKKEMLLEETTPAKRQKIIDEEFKNLAWQEYEKIHGCRKY